MAARPASFSNDSRIVKMQLSKSTLLKDYLLDDLSSCSSNGFRSYPRRRYCTKIRYLIEIDLNKHIKLPQTQSQSKSKSKLHKASAAVVNVFKSFQFTCSGNSTKPNFLIRNISRKLSNRGFCKRSTEKLKLFDESIKQKDEIIMIRSPEKSSVAVITVAGNYSSSDWSESNFTGTSDSSTEINVAQNDVVKNEQQAMENSITATNATGNEKKERKNEEKEQFSPVSEMDFPYDNDNNNEDGDEVTSPFKHNHLYPEGSKRKLMSKLQRTKSLAQLKPVRLEARITLSESRTNDSILESSLEDNQIENKAIALLQLLKTSLPSHDLSESTISVLLGFFTERITDGNVSNYDLLQEAKDWVNDQTKEMSESQNYKLTYIRYMEKEVKGSKYDDKLEKEKHPYVYGVLLFEAVATYVGQVSVLSVIALFGAATTAMITTARKTVTLLLSYIIFTNPLTRQHGSGLILIAMGVILKMVLDHKVPGYVQC